MNQRLSPTPEERASSDGGALTRKRRWTAEEDAIIIRYAGKLNDRSLAALVGRTTAATKDHRQALLGTAPKAPGWSEQELEILRKWYTTAPPAELRKMLPGRAPASIHEKVRKLGLRRFKPSTSSALPWSEDESDVMRRLYPDNAAALLLPHLPGRSQKAIERRATDMGLQHSEKFWTHHYATRISLGCYPPELQEVIRLGRKLKKAINDRESQHP